MSEITALEAMVRAEEAHLKIEAHEDLCAERYGSINQSVANVKHTVDKVLQVLAWGGSTMFGLLMIVLGWLAVRAITTNDAQFDLMQNQIQVLQQQRAAVAPAPPKKNSAVVHID